MDPQRGWPMMAEMAKPRTLTDAEYLLIKSESAALRFCVEHGRFKDCEGELAKELGVHRALLSQWKSGKKNWRVNDIDRIQELTGIAAFDDYRQRKKNDKYQRIRELEAELQKLRGAA